MPPRIPYGSRSPPPVGALLVDEQVATETVAAVRACLDNVLDHAA